MNQELGILLHISSLPGDYGIGDFGPSAYDFCEYLTLNDYKYWQTLPFTHCGYGNSPYNPLSAYAFNPYLVSPELLYQDGLVSLEDLQEAKLPRSQNVQFDSVYRTKDKLWATATRAYLRTHDLSEYISQRSWYLKPYLAFLILSHLYEDSAWFNWEEEHRRYSDSLFDSLWEQYSTKMLSFTAQQAIVEDQIHRFHKHLRNSGITLIGDIPLYLAYESADVWANQDLFDLNNKGKRLSLAGVPPDAFAKDGQLWGNPIYNWDKLAERGFDLIMKRYEHAFSYLDLLRLDHFIGYVNYWSVPEGSLTAINGHWLKARPDDFFRVLTEKYPHQKFIAEDLGVLNQEVCAYRDNISIPGMIVLQFCFEESVPKVREYPEDRILYTATHDNKTTVEWFNDLEPEDDSYINLMQYINDNMILAEGEEVNERNIHSIIIKIARQSPCRMVIIPMQDVLGLGAEARMNIPGTALGNWQWRMEYSF
ncbi:MAG TPA: 4-alpha-glucanotransferase [Candidatus Cloacimonadota bacterium]|nr:4-alpha-glucanotransferase [Candidatus Cloacimonadota bacterium]